MTRLLYIPSYLLNPLDSCATTRVDLLATSFSAESRTKRRLHRRTSCTGMRTTRRTKIINNLVFRVTCTKGFNRGFRSKFTSTGGWNGDWDARSGSVSSRRVDAYCSKRRGRHGHWASRRRQRTPPRRRRRRVILEHGRWWSRNARRLRKRLDSTLFNTLPD